MGLFGPSKDEQYRGLRDAARNVLATVKAKPYFGEQGLSADWSEGWRTVPFEFVYPLTLEALDTLIVVVHDPHSANLDALSRSKGMGKSAVLDAIRRAVIDVSSVVSGAVTDQYRSFWRIRSMALAAEDLERIVKAGTIWFGVDELERRLERSELCLPWFSDDSAYNAVFASVGAEGSRVPPSRLRQLISEVKQIREQLLPRVRRP
jgi:hypothetical protein